MADEGGYSKASPERLATDGERMLKHIQENENVRMFIAGVLVGIITLVIIFLWVRRKSRGRTLLVLGTCEAGKTTLFSQLIHKKPVETYTSTKANEGLYTPPGKALLRLVDVPGHERLRMKNFQENKDSVRAIIYVVDSSTLQKQLRDVAEYLYNVLSDPTVHAARPPLLVACNKQDLNLAKGSKLIQRELEKEFGLLRETQSHSLQGTDDTSAEQVFLGRPDDDFAFTDLKNKVSFCEISALKGADDSGYEDLQKWITLIA